MKKYILFGLMNLPMCSFIQAVNSANYALFRNAERGYASGVEQAVQAGVHPNGCDAQGRTPLMIAAQNGQLRVVKYLAELPQVDVRVTDRQGRTARDYAQQNNHTHVVHFFDTRKPSIYDARRHLQSLLLQADINGACAYLRSMQDIIKPGSYLERVWTALLQGKEQALAVLEQEP